MNGRIRRFILLSLWLGILVCTLGSCQQIQGMLGEEREFAALEKKTEERIQKQLQSASNHADRGAKVMRVELEHVQSSTYRGRVIMKRLGVQEVRKIQVEDLGNDIYFEYIEL